MAGFISGSTGDISSRQVCSLLSSSYSWNLKKNWWKNECVVWEAMMGQIGNSIFKLEQMEWLWSAFPGDGNHILHGSILISSSYFILGCIIWAPRPPPPKHTHTDRLHFGRTFIVICTPFPLTIMMTRLTSTLDLPKPLLSLTLIIPKLCHHFQNIPNLLVEKKWS